MNVAVIHTWQDVTTERSVWRLFGALFTALSGSPFWSCWISSCERSKALTGSPRLLSVASGLFFCGEANGLNSPCTLRWGWVLNSVLKEESCWVTPRRPPTSTVRITQITSEHKHEQKGETLQQGSINQFADCCERVFLVCLVKLQVIYCLNVSYSHDIHMQVKEKKEYCGKKNH